MSLLLTTLSSITESWFIASDRQKLQSDYPRSNTGTSCSSGQWKQSYRSGPKPCASFGTSCTTDTQALSKNKRNIKLLRFKLKYHALTSKPIRQAGHVSDKIDWFLASIRALAWSWFRSSAYFGSTERLEELPTVSWPHLTDWRQIPGQSCVGKPRSKQNR